MSESIRVIDDFCSRLQEVRASALQSGFGKWTPNKGEIGSSIYEGMNFWGLHSYLLGALHLAMGQPVFPNNMFFRVTNEGTEKAYVHSDRMWGAKTAIVYLSSHSESSGTGFYRHRRTGMIEMPAMENMQSEMFDELKKEMVEGSEADWEQTDFVHAKKNRALIFHAPLFHSRFPKSGIGLDAESGRMIWACHFHTAHTLAN